MMKFHFLLFFLILTTCQEHASSQTKRKEKGTQKTFLQFHMPDFSQLLTTIQIQPEDPKEKLHQRVKQIVTQSDLFIPKKLAQTNPKIIQEVQDAHLNLAQKAFPYPQQYRDRLNLITKGTWEKFFPEDLPLSLRIQGALLLNSPTTSETKIKERQEILNWLSNHPQKQAFLNALKQFKLQESLFLSAIGDGLKRDFFLSPEQSLLPPELLLGRDPDIQSYDFVLKAWGVRFVASTHGILRLPMQLIYSMPGQVKSLLALTLILWWQKTGFGTIRQELYRQTQSVAAFIGLINSLFEVEKIPNFIKKEFPTLVKIQNLFDQYTKTFLKILETSPDEETFYTRWLEILWAPPQAALQEIFDLQELPAFTQMKVTTSFDGDKLGREETKAPQDFLIQATREFLRLAVYAPIIEQMEKDKTEGKPWSQAQILPPKPGAKSLVYQNAWHPEFNSPKDKIVFQSSQEKDSPLRVIMGPNGCGKSYSLRLEGLLPLLGQTVGFTPTESFAFAPFDEIYINSEKQERKDLSQLQNELREIRALNDVIWQTQNEKPKRVLAQLDEPIRQTNHSSAALALVPMLKILADCKELYGSFVTHNQAILAVTDPKIQPFEMQYKLVPENGFNFIEASYQMIPITETERLKRLDSTLIPPTIEANFLTEVGLHISDSMQQVLKEAADLNEISIL